MFEETASDYISNIVGAAPPTLQDAVERETLNARRRAAALTADALQGKVRDNRYVKAMRAIVAGAPEASVWGFLSNAYYLIGTTHDGTEGIVCAAVAVAEGDLSGAEKWLALSTPETVATIRQKVWACDSE